MAFFLRIARLDYPNKFYFDEVYYPFTAKEYLKGNQEAWTFWAAAPPGYSYAWVNPPLGQGLMAVSMFLLGSQNPWAWRLPGVLFGVLAVYLVYLLGKNLFQKETPALISAFIFSLDGLNFVQSRIGMLDIYLVTFLLASLLFFVKKNFWASSLFLGLALATKWTAVYLWPLFFLVAILQKNIKHLWLYLIIPPVIYLFSYIPFFLYGFNINDFMSLFSQQLYYQTHLQATHSFASAFWSWPLNLYPVWYFVEYGQSYVANIYAVGNPAVFWGGTISLIFTFWQWVNKKTVSLFVILAGFLLLWLPWALSPRIMFLHYFAPAVPFMSLSLGYQLGKLWQDKTTKYLSLIFLSLTAISFLALYPFLTGLPVPKNLVDFFFVFNLSRKPF